MAQGRLLGGLRLDDRQVRWELWCKYWPTSGNGSSEPCKFAESFLSIFFDWLFQGGYVPKGEQKEDDDIFLVFDWCYLQQKP